MAMEIAKAFVSAVAATLALSLAAGDRPEAPSARVGIVIARNPERSQRIAAEEFAKMHEKVTGYRPAIATEAAGRGPFVFIGIPDADMAFEGECDSYYIRSKGANLTIAGKNVRSTLYGVFDFFRRRAGAAYFWDGDVFERRAALDFSNLDVFERSRFEYRACQYFAHRGLTRFNAEHWGFEDWKREIDWAVKNRLNVIRLCLGIEDIFQRFPRLKEREWQLAGTLSGGEQQMLAVGRAMMARPKLLMMDEPSLGLAPLVVRDIFSIIRDLKSEGITILLIEQNANAALRCADQAYVLETGRITISGTGEELLADQRVRDAYLGSAAH